MAPDQERLQQLQSEEMAVRQLLDGKVSDSTRPHIEEILRLIRAEIERERQTSAANA